jgi:transposase InsO family protein
VHQSKCLLLRGTFNTHADGEEIFEEDYALRNSAILDSGSNIHIFNDRDRFTNYSPTQSNHFVLAGTHRVPIRGYGTITLTIQNSSETRLWRLHGVAHCKEFATNLVSLQKLEDRGCWWNHKTGYIHDINNKAIASTERMHGQYVIEYRPTNLSHTAFIASHRYRRAKHSRRPTVGDATLWHLRLGHPGPEPLANLLKSTRNMSISGPKTHQCKSCAVGTLKRQESRRIPESQPSRPFEVISIDFHDFGESSLNDSIRYLLITDWYSGRIYGYHMAQKTQEAIATAIKDFWRFVFNQYGVGIKKIRSDNELLSGEVTLFASQVGMLLEPSAANTQQQNGAAERSGGVIAYKATSMRIGANLPEHLWTQIVEAAIYLHARLPRATAHWQSPYEMIETYFRNRHGTISEILPSIDHLKAYGCRAYPMKRETQLKLQKRRKLKEKAHIGYLIGYKSTNIFQIWILVLSRVIDTRDVIFDETKFYDPAEHLEDQRLKILIEELANQLQLAEIPTLFAEDETSEVESVYSLDLEGPEEPGNLEAPEGLEQYEAIPTEAESQKQGEMDIDAVIEAYPTPVTPRAFHVPLTIRGMRGPQGVAIELPETDDERFASFITSITPNQLNSQLQSGLSHTPKAKYAGKEVPKPPKRQADLLIHPFRTEFKQAERDHLESHREFNTFTEIDESEVPSDHQILDCMWVYVYK